MLPLLLKRNRSLKQSHDPSRGWGHAPTTQCSPQADGPIAPPAAPPQAARPAEVNKTVIKTSRRHRRTFRQEDGIDCSVLRLPFGTAGGLIFEKCSDPIINPSKEQYMSWNAALLFSFPSPKDLLRALTLNKNRNVSLQISFGFASFNIKIQKASPLECRILFCCQIRKRNIFAQKEHTPNFNPIYQQMFCSQTCLYCFIALSDKVLAKATVTQVPVKSFQQSSLPAFHNGDCQFTYGVPNRDT